LKVEKAENWEEAVLLVTVVLIPSFFIFPFFNNNNTKTMYNARVERVLKISST
jgi:hypothetical protein